MLLVATSSISGARAAALRVTYLRMPGLNGFEVQEVLMRQRRKVPVIILTADDTPANAARARELGAAGFLPKDVDSELLLGAIQKAISTNVR